MNRRKQSNQSAAASRDRGSDGASRRQNKSLLRDILGWFFQPAGLFPKHLFHGNIKWEPKQLLAQALVWSWQETRYVTDAFAHALEVCNELRLEKTAKSYTSMMNALDRYGEVFASRLRQRFQTLAKEIGGRHWKTGGWVAIAFDGSRVTAPRTVSNERALCAANYGQGKRAKYGKKKSKGMRRKRNKQNPPHPQAPQAWITMLWHMGLRLPWTWRLGPSNSSERDHVKEILTAEEFPKRTLFCGDAGFTGYQLWSLITTQDHHFLVRVGGNVNLLSEHADVKKLGDGIVLCWPKGQMDAGRPPLRLRLVRVKVGKTLMWMLTSVLDPKQLTHKQIVKLYQMRWGIEVEYRGLKQTIDKHALRCRNAARLLVELNWSLYGMAVAELLALREQIAAAADDGETAYDPKHRSLANTMRVLRKCMRNLHKRPSPTEGLACALSQALVQRYKNVANKRSRYRPKNPDKKELGEPTIRKLNAAERKELAQHASLAAA